MDFAKWHIVLNSSHKNYQITNYEKRLIFKPSWQKSRWLRMVLKGHKPVQLVTAKLYLPDAERIWTRNRQTKEKLESMGFKHVKIKRIKCPS